MEQLKAQSNDRTYIHAGITTWLPRSIVTFNMKGAFVRRFRKMAHHSRISRRPVKFICLWVPFPVISRQSWRATSVKPHAARFSQDPYGQWCLQYSSRVSRARGIVERIENEANTFIYSRGSFDFVPVDIPGSFRKTKGGNRYIAVITDMY